MATINSTAPGEVIVGTDGIDILTAQHNDVTLIGGAGGDGISTGDELYSDLGVDGTIMEGGAGIDFLTGNGTNDTASYANAPAGVTVDLFVEEFDFGAAFADGYGTLDSLVGIENVTGSSFADSLTGDDLANVLTGGAGDDTLAGGAGNDVFNYSFDLTQSSGGGSTTTQTFTDWLSAKYGKDFGDELPDFSPKQHDHHHKHGRNDDRRGDDDHHKNNYNQDDDNEHQQGGGLTEKFFEQNYKEWINEVVVSDLLEQGFVLDANGDGKIKIDINDDSRNGTPRIEGLTKDQLAEIFGDRDSVILRDGHHAEKAWYSNSFTSTSDGETTVSVTSGDGLDTIVDFAWGEDHLEFNGLGVDFTLAQFQTLFVATETDVNNDAIMDTTLALADDSWEVTLLGVSGHTEAEFHAASVFS